MGLLPKPQLARSYILREREAVNEQGENLILRNDTQSMEGWTFYEGNGGAPFTDMTWNYNRVTTNEFTFTRRAMILSAQVAASWDSAAGWYRCMVQIEIGKDPYTPDMILACTASGDGAGDNCVSFPIGVIVEPGTKIWYGKYFRLTNAAYWLTGGVQFKYV